MEDEKPPPEEVDETYAIRRRARARALAMVEEVERNGGPGMEIGEGDDEDLVAAITRRKKLHEEEEEEKAKERMRQDVLARRRSLEMDRGTPMYWVGADARKELSLDSDDDPFDMDDQQPWKGRLSPIELADDEPFPWEDEAGWTGTVKRVPSLTPAPAPAVRRGGKMSAKRKERGRPKKNAVSEAE